MSKWKCEICGLEFENFHAQGFNHKIYCPLCYYKELYKINTKEIDRLNNILNELEREYEELREIVRKQLNSGFLSDEELKRTSTRFVVYNEFLDKLKELKENSNE